MQRKPHFEITTQIGCRVNCIKYCPQEIITQNYEGERTLTLSNFMRLIQDVPASNPIIFSGLSEPFLNPETPYMMQAAHRLFHPIIVFSTLVGLTPTGANIIKDIPFERFTLHLPDPYNVSNIPETNDYNKSLNLILRNVERLWFMNMGYYFRSDCSNERVRGTCGLPKKRGRQFCDHHEYPDYFVLPNGDTYFCCQTRGQSCKVGNLFEESYGQLLEKYPAMSKDMQTDPDSICHHCAIATPYWMYPIKRMFGETLINIGKRYFL